MVYLDQKYLHSDFDVSFEQQHIKFGVFFSEIEYLADCPSIWFGTPEHWRYGLKWPI